MAAPRTPNSAPDDPDGVGSGGSPSRERPVDRLLAVLRPTGGPDRSGPSGTRTISAKGRIEGLDARERSLTIVAAGLAVAMGVIIYVSETRDHHFRLGKGQLTPQTTLILGLVFGALLLGAALIGRRAPIGFVALFAFLAFGTTSFVLGLPFLVLAAWLLFRSYKFQKEAAATRAAGRAAGSGGAAGSSGAASPSPRARGARGADRTAPAKDRAKGPAVPEANKRFTPKRPPPPPVKPSRKERRAAQAQD